MAPFVRSGGLAVAAFLALELLPVGKAAAAPGACQQVRMACRAAGFQPGAGANGLMVGCFDPIVRGTTQPRRASRPLPSVGADVAARCRAASGQTDERDASSPAGRSNPRPESSFSTVRGALWLTDMNLPATKPFTVPRCNAKRTNDCINPNGSMDYQAAVAWIEALNEAGYEGRYNWQLPTTQDQTIGCLSNGRNRENFGYQCTGSALGGLYYKEMGLKAPASVVPASGTPAPPPHPLQAAFTDLQPNYYWSGTPSNKQKVGYFSFSFADGWRGSNIGADSRAGKPAASYFYVLPLLMLGGDKHIPGTIYDPNSGATWLADGNLAAKKRFGLAQCTKLDEAAPCVNANGTMIQTSAQAFVAAMNKANYLGYATWMLPPSEEPIKCQYEACAEGPNAGPMALLYYKLLGLAAGESVAGYYTQHVGKFTNVQPYLYWSCQANNYGGPVLASTCSVLPQCAPAPNSVCPSTGPMEWSFNFAFGLQGTTEESADLFVTAFSPETNTPTPPPNPIGRPPCKAPDCQ